MRSYAIHVRLKFPNTTIQYFSEISSHGGRPEGEGLRLSTKVSYTTLDSDWLEGVQ